MLRIGTIEEYDKQINALTDIIAGITGISNSLDDVVKWLEQLEQVALEHGDRVASDIALAKGDILTYLPTPEELNSVSRGQRPKLKKQYVIRRLKEVKDCVEQYLAKSRVLIEETEVLCYKLAAVAAQKGYITDKQRNLQEAVELIKKDAELMPAWVNVIGTVGMANAWILLDRALDGVS